MDEREQVDEKIDLKVRTVSDSTVPASQEGEPQPELELAGLQPEAQPSIVAESLSSDSSKALMSPSEFHASAAKMKPLPAHIIAGASFSQALNRPAPMLGQVLCVFLVIAGLAYLWAHHMLGIGGSAFIYLIPGALTLAFASPILLLMKVQAKLLTELFAGIMYPISSFDKKELLPFSAGVLGDSLQGRNMYSLAACCYAECVRYCHPTDILSKSRSMERELIISLAFAGKSKQSLFYADNAVRYADYLLSTVDTGVARNYFAFATRTAGMAYELAGERAKSIELRKRCYEATKDLPLSNESRLFGNLARAEAYCLEGEFSNALPLLQDFVQNVSFGHLMSSDPVLKSRGCHLLAVCHAHLADYEEARRMHKLGCERGGSDLSTYVKAEGVSAEAQILKLSGQTEEADALIDTFLKKLQVPPASVIWQRLTSLQSKPSDAISLSRHYEDDISESTYDDEPVPPPILPDERSLANSLKRTLIGVSLVTLIAFFFNPRDVGYLLIFIPVIIFGITVLRSKTHQINAAASAISNGTPIFVKVKMWGLKDLYLYRDDGKCHSYEALSVELCRKLQTVACDKQFDAVAYADESGDIAAVQILGFYSSVKRTKK